MTLNDQIIDEAEELAANRILGNDPTDSQIIDAVSDIVRVHLHPNSIGAHLALAAYNRVDNAIENIRSVSRYENFLMGR